MEPRQQAWWVEILNDFLNWAKSLPPEDAGAPRPPSGKRALAELFAQMATVRKEVSIQGRLTKNLEREFKSAVQGFATAGSQMSARLAEVADEVARPDTAHEAQAVVFDMLDIRDALQRTHLVAERLYEQASAEAGIIQSGAGGLADTLGLIIRKFDAVLAGHGIEHVPALGQPFDPATMNAVGTKDVSDGPDGLVVDEVRGGFRYQGRMLRTAAVFVSVVREQLVAESPEGDAAAEAGPDGDGPASTASDGEEPLRGYAEDGPADEVARDGVSRGEQSPDAAATAGEWPRNEDHFEEPEGDWGAETGSPREAAPEIDGAEVLEGEARVRAGDEGWPREAGAAEEGAPGESTAGQPISEVAGEEETAPRQEHPPGGIPQEPRSAGGAFEGDVRADAESAVPPVAAAEGPAQEELSDDEASAGASAEGAATEVTVGAEAGFEDAEPPEEDPGVSESAGPALGDEAAPDAAADDVASEQGPLQEAVAGSAVDEASGSEARVRAGDEGWPREEGTAGEADLAGSTAQEPVAEVVGEEDTAPGQEDSPEGGPQDLPSAGAELEGDERADAESAVPPVGPEEGPAEEELSEDEASAGASAAGAAPVGFEDAASPAEDPAEEEVSEDEASAGASAAGAAPAIAVAAESGSRDAVPAAGDLKAASPVERVPEDDAPMEAAAADGAAQQVLSQEAVPEGGGGEVSLDEVPEPELGGDGPLAARGEASPESGADDLDWVAPSGGGPAGATSASQSGEPPSSAAQGSLEEEDSEAAESAAETAEGAMPEFGGDAETGSGEGESDAGPPGTQASSEGGSEIGGPGGASAQDGPSQGASSDEGPAEDPTSGGAGSTSRERHEDGHGSRD